MKKDKNNKSIADLPGVSEREIEILDKYNDECQAREKVNAELLDK